MRKPGPGDGIAFDRDLSLGVRTTCVGEGPG